MPETHNFNFSVNNWTHLYSLQKAILHNDQLTGRTLSITGKILNQPFLQNITTDIVIRFLQTERAPEYPVVHSDARLLGYIRLSDQSLSSDIKVDSRVFDELRKNLTEYADIEGIHIVVTLGILSDTDVWQEGESLEIVQLDYAMKGDT